MLTLNPLHKSLAVQNEDHGRSSKGVAESEGGQGRCKKFDGAGVQAKSVSDPENVDIEVEVKFWFHRPLVSSQSKEEGKVSRSRPCPRYSSVLATACRALACCKNFLGRSMRNDGCSLATSADTVKASFFQSLGSRGDIQVSSTRQSTQQLGLKTVSRTPEDSNKEARTQQLEQRNSKTHTR